ncbi:hypothetical protein ASPCAL05180 [Aspergillus calidoustus]|uniref:Zn(2)-C6 fungal-type domain-containing protein n=1 Tax=Aspergillus calidoustus TaxID=454130 RepID=A0A0U5G3E2_ASPCI|nr:hypothetical protein ASPCAL05180 [Aspergillus calidoustus]
MAGDQPATPTRTAKRDSHRSRKGCPECRSRKIKCDEQKPECGQCLKSGRACRIIDSIFKPHSYSFRTTPAQRPQLVDRVGPSTRLPPESAAQNAAEETQELPIQPVNTDSPITSPSQAILGKRILNVSPITAHDQGTDCVLSGHTVNETVDPNSGQDSASLLASPHGIESTARPYATPIGQLEDNYQDRCEIAFFLRHFSEGPGQWMDVCGDRSYFSQQVIQLSHWSPLIRYAACALGAKQLGQTRHPEAQIRHTNTQTLMLKALIDTKVGFTWYGAKYYEKAIQLLAQQISQSGNPSCSLSPNYIYGTGLTPQSGEFDLPRDHDEAAAPFQILAACILCQYEDVNATLRAWSGHIDGIHRLLRPHLPDLVAFRVAKRIPQPERAFNAVFWFYVVNDMLNAFILKRKTRVNTDDLVLWRRMGVPLDDHGNLARSTTEGQLEVTLFKTLVRMMCQLVNSELNDAGQWAILKAHFDRWQSMVPQSFYIPITWPPVAEPSNIQNVDAFTREIWFASDISAITLAFYHMSRMILLVNCPMDLFINQREDLLSAYNILQQELRQHAMEIIPIMHAKPSETVQKYMLQPLYVAGRCLTDEKERKSLLQILRNMADDFGLFTDDRIKDLCEEWGMPCNGIDRKDGHGILT